MNNLIDRQAAIEAAMQDVSCIRTHEFNAGAIRAANRIKQLPSAEPKRGKWVYQNGMIKCDQCLRAIRRIDHDGILNFCPNCGADMRGERNETD